MTAQHHLGPQGFPTHKRKRRQSRGRRARAMAEQRARQAAAESRRIR
jgi:hypothetical protein